jgi:hypothetical protein
MLDTLTESQRLLVQWCVKNKMGVAGAVRASIVSQSEVDEWKVSTCRKWIAACWADLDEDEPMCDAERDAAVRGLRYDALEYLSRAFVGGRRVDKNVLALAQWVLFEADELMQKGDKEQEETPAELEMNNVLKMFR